jgi:lipopolysaccharide export LptBFGC system permease protein LptF
MDQVDDTKNVSGNERTTLEILKDINKNKKDVQAEINMKKQNLNNLIEETRLLKDNFKKYYNGNISDKEYNDALQRIDNNLGSILIQKKEIEKVRSDSLIYNLIEFYKKFALPFACVIFAIFAAPIGIYSRRAGFSIGFIVGLFLSAVYWFSYYGGQVLGIRNVIPPFLAVFIPNIIFLIIGINFLIKRLKE